MPKPTRAHDTQSDDPARVARRQADQAAASKSAAGSQTAPSAQSAPAAGHVQRLPDNPAAASASDVAQLQTRYANRAVQRLLTTHTVQAKLQVGPANDRYEQEADHVAQQVMRLPAASKEDDEQKA